MNRPDTGQGIIDFLIEDFKDTSAKLESTDKKIQFIVQIYVALITAILSATLFFFANQFSDIIAITKNPDGQNNILFLFMGVILFFFLGFSCCVYLYNQRGNFTHRIYISRMNFLRNVILQKHKISTEKLENFYFTNKKTGKVGMGAALNLFLLITITLYLYILLTIILYPFHKIYIAFLILIVPPIFIFFVHKFFTKYYNDKAEKTIDENWEIKKIENS